MLLKRGKALEQDPLGWRCNLVADGKVGSIRELQLVKGEISLSDWPRC